MSSLRIGAAVAIGLALTACGPITEEQPAAPECSFAAQDVDPLRELLVVDERVMKDDAANNGSGGALSFHHAVEALVPAGADPAAATLAWLEGWAPASLRCEWLRARPANACDATCETCRERIVALEQAPFRLIAVANRLDLAESGKQSAEGRLLFAATEGPGDDPRSPSLPVTAIFEFRLTGKRREWATRWHALGAKSDVDASWIQSLTAVTSRFVRGEELAQIRVQDALRTRPALYEFHVNGGRFVRAGLRRTPAHSMNDSTVLADFARSNEEAILSDRFELPSWMLTDRIELGETWTLPGIDEPLRHAFAQSTCDGCHGKEHPTTDGSFHVSPYRRGTEKLSRFLFDPERRDDELARRAAVLSRFACGQ